MHKGLLQSMSNGCEANQKTGAHPAHPTTMFWMPPRLIAHFCLEQMNSQDNSASQNQTFLAPNQAVTKLDFKPLNVSLRSSPVGFLRMRDCVYVKPYVSVRVYSRTHSTECSFLLVRLHAHARNFRAKHRLCRFG